MSRSITGLWRALVVLDAGDHEEILQTEPPTRYDDVARWLLVLQHPDNERQGYVEDKRALRALMVEVGT